VQHDLDIRILFAGRADVVQDVDQRRGLAFYVLVVDVVNSHMVLVRNGLAGKAGQQTEAE
jgi:hypothetical protein